MIKRGSKIKLYPYFSKKDDPSALIEFKENEYKGVRFKICQTIDYSRVGDKREGTFLKCSIISDLPLSIGDEVIVEDIVNVSVSKYGVVLTITVERYADGIQPPKEQGFNPYR